MDSRAPTWNTRNEKFHNQTQKAVEDNGDIISNLPERIISHIMSFLPIKDAVRTSVLSTRWIYMWTSITNLHFDDTLLYCERNERPEKESFMNFVERVLVHVNAPIISSFTLLCSTTYEAYRLNSWISSILRCNIKKLHVHHYGEIPISSRSLFSCDSLEDLQLCVPWNLVIPTSATLSNLQILRLEKARFLSDSTSHLEELTLSFPVLKVFEVKSCGWIDVPSFSIKAPLLESFYASNLGIEFRHHDPCNFFIKIFAWHLKKFSFYGQLFLDFVLLDSISSPLDVTISISLGITDYRRYEEVGSRAWVLLRQFHEVKYLRLEQNSFKFLTKEFAADLPTFERLERLEIQGPDLCKGEILSKLLHKAPNLKTLHCEKVPCRN